MFVGPNFHIDTVIVEQILQTKPMGYWKANPQHRFILFAIVFSDVAAVHWTMTEGDNPGT